MKYWRYRCSFTQQNRLRNGNAWTRMKISKYVWYSDNKRLKVVQHVEWEKKDCLWNYLNLYHLKTEERVIKEVIKKELSRDCKWKRPHHKIRKTDVYGNYDARNKMNILTNIYTYTTVYDKPRQIRVYSSKSFDGKFKRIYTFGKSLYTFIIYYFQHILLYYS